MIIKMNDEFEARMMLTNMHGFKEFKENNLGVVGSRTFKNEGFMSFVLSMLRPNHIISGGAKGADSLAVGWAVQTCVPFTEHLPDLIRWPWTKYKGKAYLERNDTIAMACDALVAFVPLDGESTGTMYTVGKAVSFKKPVLILYFEG